VVRRDILEAIIRTVAEEGRTVLFSSHLLEEVERVADDLAMMVDGEVVFSGQLDDIKETHHRLVVRFDSPQRVAPEIYGALSISGSGLEWTVVCNGSREQVLAAAAKSGGRVVSDDPPSLDEIFVARAGRKTVERSV